MFFSVGWANGEAFRAGSQNGVYRFLASVMVACLFLRVESDGGGRWTVSESVSAAEEKCARWVQGRVGDYLSGDILNSA